jgi:glycosyltransferase involved in cell wall biosynthesis
MAVDGVVEVVRDGINGFLIAEGDTAALAARVVDLLEDPVARAALAVQAPEGLDEFDRDVMVRRQEAMYVELAASAGLLGPQTPDPGPRVGGAP